MLCFPKTLRGMTLSCTRIDLLTSHRKSTYKLLGSSNYIINLCQLNPLAQVIRRVDDNAFHWINRLPVDSK